MPPDMESLFPDPAIIADKTPSPSIEAHFGNTRETHEHTTVTVLHPLRQSERRFFFFSASASCSFPFFVCSSSFLFFSFLSNLSVIFLSVSPSVSPSLYLHL